MSECTEPIDLHGGEVALLGNGGGVVVIIVSKRWDGLQDRIDNDANVTIVESLAMNLEEGLGMIDSNWRGRGGRRLGVGETTMEDLEDVRILVTKDFLLFLTMCNGNNKKRETEKRRQMKDNAKRK